MKAARPASDGITAAAAWLNKMFHCVIIFLGLNSRLESFAARVYYGCSQTLHTSQPPRPRL